jgi:hypothetical protein
MELYTETKIQINVALEMYANDDCLYHDKLTNSIELVKLNILVNRNFYRHINISMFEESLIKISCEKIEYNKRNWYVLLVQLENDTYDTLYHLMSGKKFSGTTYMFSKLAMRNQCYNIIYHIREEWRHRKYYDIPYIEDVENSNTCSCRCGGRYTIKTHAAHFVTSLHWNWKKTC